MAVLTNKSIASTYKSVLSIGATTESALTSSIQQLTDGLGNGSPLSMSTTQIQFNDSSNTFLFPATRGTINQILKLADANGTLDWADDNLSNTLNFSGEGSTTGSVTLDTQTLAFTGTANQIETSASSQSITLSFPTAGVVLPDGSSATTQAASDNSTKVATTAYVTTAVSSFTGDVTKTGTITQNQIAVWNDSTDELRSDATITVSSTKENEIILLQPYGVSSIDKSNYNIGGGNTKLNQGLYNTGFGKFNLSNQVSGNINTAIGYQALWKLAGGTGNTVVGAGIAGYLTTGDLNTFIGGAIQEQSQNSDVEDCVAVGYYSNRFGQGDKNTSVGTYSYAGVSPLTTGELNTVIGYRSGFVMTTGSKNVIIGSFEGFRAAAVGGLPEYSIITSSNNIVLSDGDGNVRQVIDSNGNVGIGDITSPTYRIEANTTSGGNGIKILRGSTSMFEQFQSTTGTVSLAASGTGGTAGSFSFRTGTSVGTTTPKLTITSGGLVGIGNTNPSDYSADANNLVVGSLSGNNGITILSNSSSNFGSLYFADGITGNQVNSGYIRYQQNQSIMSFGVNAVEALNISLGGDATFSANVGIGVSPTAKLHIQGTNSSSGGIKIHNSAGNPYGIYSDNNDLLFTNGDGISTALTISYAGNIGVGVSPSSTVLLDLKEPDAATDLILGLSAGTGARAQIRSIAQGNDTKAELSFHVVTGGSTSEAMRIDQYSTVTVQNGIKFGTGVTLNAYEEGVWTPTMNTSQGNLATFTSSGTYTRIGRLVSLQITYTLTATGTPTPSAGAILVQNIPFSKIGNEAFLSGFGQQASAGQSLIAFNYASGNTTIGIYRGDGNFAGALNEVSVITVQYLTP